jgi:hypothetical protein
MEQVGTWKLFATDVERHRVLQTGRRLNILDGLGLQTDVSRSIMNK